jgi:hypothetical protein
MSQLHRRLSDEQVRVLLQSYCAGQLKRADVQDVLEARPKRSPRHAIRDRLAETTSLE